MSIVSSLATSMGRRDEIPNQDLARVLAQTQDTDGLREAASLLFGKDQAIACDCIKVLYETGYIAPALIVPYAADFLRLLASRNNRLVWGAMIALGIVAPWAADEIFSRLEEVLKAFHSGSVITVDNAIKVLSGVASQKSPYHERIFPILLKHLSTCRPKELAQHAESSLPAVEKGGKEAFVSALRNREAELTLAQHTRIKKLVKLLEKSNAL